MRMLRVRLPTSARSSSCVGVPAVTVAGGGLYVRLMPEAVAYCIKPQRWAFMPVAAVKELPLTALKLMRCVTEFWVAPA